MATVNTGNIILLDPNTVNTNPNITNGVPQYQDMFIFAELRAIRKGRTVLETMSERGTGANVMITGLEDIKEVNFLGINQNSKSPDYRKFTTRYYDGSNDNNIQYEGFGMSNIKVTINSSFIPQVSIQFIDVRGLAFFNRENSPYRILFDFPPPIFYLKIKGYYGKALEYKLHLVKYTSNFKSENGNYVIDAQFVAVTYAPLTDVLFRYIVNFPLIPLSNGAISLSANPNVPPKNTYELILKLKNLYDNVQKELKSLSETQKYDSTLNLLTNNTSVVSMIADYKHKLRDSAGNAYLVSVDTSVPYSQTASNAMPLYPFVINNNSQPTLVDEKNIVTITSFSDYDNIIKSLGIPATQTNTTKRLYIVCVSGKISTIPYTGVEDITTKVGLAMDTYKAELINAYKDAGNSNTNISIPSVYFSNPYDVTIFRDNKPSTIYTGLDITNFYTKLYKDRVALNQTKATLSNTINGIINNMIMKNLGMMPTIYNIFNIILNDVDTFFQTLRDTSISSEQHHNQADYNKIILSKSPDQFADINPQTNTTKLFSFPLVIDTQNICGGQRQVKVSPVKISQLLPQPFPELTLVESFVETFNKQRNFSQLMNAKNELNDDGTYKWIPVSPLDSKLGSPTTQTAYSGPYFGVDTIDGGGSVMPVNVSNEKRLAQVIKIMLDRFYIISQSSYPTSFYDTDKKVSKAYVEFFAKSEAANLANSITETKYSNNIKDNANKFSNIDNFYAYLSNPKNNILDHYIFTQAERTSFPLAGDIPADNDAYVDKTNSNYMGSIVKNEKIDIQTFTKDNTKPVNAFQNDVMRGLFGNIFKGRTAEDFYNFTNENLLYIIDKFSKDHEEDSDKVILDNNNTNIKTRFLDSNAYGIVPDFPTTKVQIGENQVNKIDVIPKLLASGNTYFYNKNIGGFNKSTAQNLKSFDKIINPWIDQLSKHDDAIKKTIFSGNNPLYNQKLSALLFLSNYGYTLGPFNQYPHKLNQLIFNIAGVIETPTYLPAYIGAILTAIDGIDPTFTVQKIEDFFTTGEGQVLDSFGLFIFADIHDIDKYLSAKDKQVYKEQFDLFMSSGQYNTILTGVQNMYKDVTGKTVTLNNSVNEIIAQKKKLYDFYLNPKSTESGSGFRYYEILTPLITRTNIINYSDITFSTGTTKTGYISLQTLNADTTHPKIKMVNDSFFQTFFSELSSKISTKQSDLKKEEIANNKLKGDEDIITQTYYSFKNINDKWLTNPENANVRGYPSNEVGKSLIDSFAFVDRAMNPIGDTIINAEILLQMLDDPNISVFSVISQILSLNGFEFFPLQNFMSYTQDSWTESFMISTDVNTTPRATFVCMLIGGTSSYPTGVANGFVDDGITDLSTQATVDFKTKPPIDSVTKQLNPNISINSEDGKQVSRNNKFPWGQVRAFRVKFGEQNQSMFLDMKIDSKEYPETNESIQILARLAGDNKIQAPVPKGQNLFNLYENRAYKATIMGMGNAMIQPTQYFQLENVPLFSGAYIILGVEHIIEPNKMNTNFYGTKILRYPVPRVLNPAAIMGFDGGDSDETSLSDKSAGELTKGVQAITMSQPRIDKLNSVFGIDVSKWQENFNWTNAVKSTNPDFPNPQFALIKASQGESKDRFVMMNANGAKTAGLKIGYYHYAKQYIGANIEANIIADAKTQANFFVSTVQSLPHAPDFPLILDMEDETDANGNIIRGWSVDKKVNDKWINTFVAELKNKGYNTILYGGKPFYTEKTSNNFGSQPLWHAQYPEKPEQTNPTIATGWKDWTIWQFSSKGKINGNKGDVDISVMRKNFFDSPNTA
ncbi:MAG: glycoside hydrolase family 25 protein [Candidatus Paceibacterota bacterium]